MTNLEKQVLDCIHQYIADTVKLNQVDSESTFVDLGMDSVAAVEMTGYLSSKFNINVDPIMLYDYPTPASFSSYVANTID